MCSQLLICMIFTFFVNMNFKGLFGPKANNFRKSSTKLQALPKFTRKVIKKHTPDNLILITNIIYLQQKVKE